MAPQYEGMHLQEPIQTQIQSLKSDIKQLQADAIKPPPQSVAEAAVHTENFITLVPSSSSPSSVLRHHTLGDFTTSIFLNFGEA